MPNHSKEQIGELASHLADQTGWSDFQTVRLLAKAVDDTDQQHFDRHSSIAAEVD